MRKTESCDAKTDGKMNVRTPLRFSLRLAAAIFGICLVDMMVRPPDTVSGVVIAGDKILRLVVGIILAIVGLVGSLLALRLSKGKYLSIPRAVTVVVLYAICMYLPVMQKQTVAITVGTPGHIEASSGSWQSLAEPLVVPFLGVLVLTHFSFRRSREK